MTLQDCAAAALRLLEAAGFEPDSARTDIAVLARSILRWDAAEWLVRQRDDAPPDFAPRLLACIERRARREPVAYITGEREFYGRTFVVTPAVLIPRPDTETLVSVALTCLDRVTTRAPLVADVGTGSGCVAVTLAAERHAVRVVATDVSGAALEVARENARRLRVRERVTFVEGSLFAGLDEPPDLIVSNPPYVREIDRPTLATDVVGHEPHAALFAGPDGLDVIRALVQEASRRLAPGGWLVFEIGFDQADAVLALIGAAGTFEAVDVVPDLESRPRVVVARRL